MYWLNGIASQLSLRSASRGMVASSVEGSDQPTGAQLPLSVDIVAMKPSYHASLFITCTRSAIYLWSVKPTTILSFVERSEKHIKEFGENESILWKPDGSAVVIITSKNYLLLYAILPFEQRSFEFSFARSQHPYVTGPGEGKGPKTMLLKFRLAIRIDAGIVCGTSSDDTLIIATQTPAAIQCISWNPQQVNATQTSLQSRMGIFVDPLERVSSMIYNRPTNVSVWITDKGRAYFVHNVRTKETTKDSNGLTSPTSPSSQFSRGSATSPSKTNFGEMPSFVPVPPSYADTVHWKGIGFHGVGKEIQEGEEATCFAINAKFSLIAVGTKSGSIRVYSAHNYMSPPEYSHTLELPSGGTGTWGPNHSKASTRDSVQSLAWTSDGYALSAGYVDRGLAIWSVYGALLSSMSEVEEMFGERQNNPQITNRYSHLQDTYINGVYSMFWGPGNHQLFVLDTWGLKDKESTKDGSVCDDIHLFSLPFSKLAITSLHNADNARRGLLQADDRLLLYNSGGDYQENNTTTIDPDAVAWTHILYPTMYITDHWPIRCSSVSRDGKYIAIAGKRGLAHYNTTSGRWKMFGNQQQEKSFLVRGGLAWYKHVLVAACEVPLHHGNIYEIRLYSRDSNLDNAYILHTEVIHHIPNYITICGNFLLVYTSDNILNIYSIFIGSDVPPTMGNLNPTANLARIKLSRQISLDGIITNASRVRGISLFNPNLGDQLNTLEDVITANIIFLVDGKTFMMCPSVEDDQDDGIQNQYEIHMLSEKTEYYWIGRKSVANLLTSLWVVNGKGVKLFTNLLRGEDCGFSTFGKDIYESEPSTPTTPGLFTTRGYAGRPFSLGYRIGPEPDSPSASVNMEGFSQWRTGNLKFADSDAIHIPLDFYPHSVLLEKGIIVGIEQNMVYKDLLGFMVYKITAKTHLFIHHILRHLLKRDLEEDAVVFARVYEKLVYFSHALEILLHTVLEEESGQSLGEEAILPLVIKFLDQFPHALDVIVSCARKTEVALWDHLFSAVGKPKDLFEFCLEDGRLRTATSYLIILQTMQPLAVGGKDTIRLLQKAIDVDDYELCKELVRFLSSIDNTGKTLQEALHVIKAHMDPSQASNNQDAQVDKMAQSMQDLSA
ncbi:RIC1-domain-containing protein [Phycomyces nitens]|nr:RIC1-domain-containing protein [Phycomyces nitens]